MGSKIVQLENMIGKSQVIISNEMVWANIKQLDFSLDTRVDHLADYLIIKILSDHHANFMEPPC